MLRAELIRVVKRCLLRTLLIVGVVAVLASLCAGYAFFIEPTWLRVRHIAISSDPTVRVIHISDVHFTGDTQYLEKVVGIINGIDADFVCFTGDLIEDAACLDGALKIISNVNKPMYGIAGNHDIWALQSFEGVRAAFRKTGGDWLSDKLVELPLKQVTLMTLASCRQRASPGCKRILLEHYPDDAVNRSAGRFDLILSGHTHGGQIRIPFVHRLVIPFDLGTHDKGLFNTEKGPLYVSPGIGTYYLSMRFLCRPEITVFEI
jgi:uncharacterized protein